MPTPPATPYPLQIRGGPYTWLVKTGKALAENEPYLASVLLGDGSYFYMQWIGCRDKVNRLIACSGQSDGKPSFQAPQGAWVYDWSINDWWVSNGWTGGAPADGIDQPIEGRITASNFLGWALSPASSGNGNGLGNIGTIDGGTWI